MPHSQIQHTPYRGGAVQSLKFDLESTGETWSVGVMTPGEWRFDAEVDEELRIVVGSLVDGRFNTTHAWNDNPFLRLIPAGTSVTFVCEDNVAYTCKYGTEPSQA